MRYKCPSSVLGRQFDEKLFSRDVYQYYVARKELLTLLVLSPSKLSQVLCVLLVSVLTSIMNRPGIAYGSQTIESQNELGYVTVLEILSKRS